MPTVASIKAAIKSILDGTGQFGSVYTEDRERIEKPQPAAVVMWHDGGNQVPGPGTAVTRTTFLLVRALVPRAPAGGEVKMQQDTDSKLETILSELRQKPTLDTGSGPLVLSAFAESWDINYDPDTARMVAEVRVAIEYEEG